MTRRNLVSTNLKNEAESSSVQSDTFSANDLPSQTISELSSISNTDEDKKKKKKEKKKDKKKPEQVPQEEVQVSVPAKETPKDAAVKEAVPTKKKKQPVDLVAEAPKVDPKNAAIKQVTPAPSNQKRKGKSDESTNGQDPLAATNAEVDALEKELANATREMQELEAKLMSLKMKNQEFENYTL